MGKYTSTDPNHVFPNRPIPAKATLKAYTRHTPDDNGCWISEFAPNPINGYSSVGWRDGDKWYGTGAHRASYVHVNGPIPDGMVIDHLCHTRRCVNPAHLRALPRHENARRQIAGDFPLGQCRNGHPLSESRKRTSGRSKGLTYCGACQDERNDVLKGIRLNLRLLEITYGLGDWHTKKSYASALRIRAARVEARKHERENAEETK